MNEKLTEQNSHENFLEIKQQDNQFIPQRHNLNEIITNDFEKDLNISDIGLNIDEELKIISEKEKENNNIQRKETLTDKSTQ